MARQKQENHKTAQQILQGAKRLFLLKGFDGTSINDIANDIKIHKSLIYHHFGSKESLWKAVKESLIKEVIRLDLDQVNFSRRTLKGFLEDFVTFRFNLYATKPEIVRLMHWQRLEPKVQSLKGVDKPKLNDLEEEIISLQKLGEIRSDLDPHMVMYLIRSTASNGFMDREPFLESKEGQDRYLNFIIEGLYRVLSPKP